MKKIVIGIGIIISPFLIWFCIVFDFKGEAILIPKNYSGTCIIFYNVDYGEGLQSSTMAGRIILKIPTTGVLRVNFGNNYERKKPLKNRKYYLYDPLSGKITDELVQKDMYSYSNSFFELKEGLYTPSLGLLYNKKGMLIKEEGFITSNLAFKNIQIKSIDAEKSLIYDRIITQQ